MKTILVSAMLLLGLTQANASQLTVKEGDLLGKTDLVKTAPANVQGVKQTILTDREGLSVYTFDLDSPNVSACAGDCLTEWPPVHVEPSSTAKSPFGQIKGNDGRQQLTLNGFPLYHYDDDKKPGDVFGQYPKWNVVKVAKSVASLFSVRLQTTSCADGENVIHLSSPLLPLQNKKRLIGELTFSADANHIAMTRKIDCVMFYMQDEGTFSCTTSDGPFHETTVVLDPAPVLMDPAADLKYIDVYDRQNGPYSSETREFNLSCSQPTIR